MLASLTKTKLINLYSNKKFSTRKIAITYKCSKSAINSRLKRFNIPIRSKEESVRLRPPHYKYTISEKKLRNLYLRKKLSAYAIAKVIGCGPTVIFNRLRMYGIERRNLSESVQLTNQVRLPKIAASNIKYPRKNFSGNLIEKAYLIGFRLGDLHVSKKPHGETILIQSWSTKLEQNILISELFSDYRHLGIHQRIKHNKIDTGISCYLNQTFDFLLDKSDEIPPWIIVNKNYFYAFLAGYTDAEGNFNVDHGFARFSISTYQQIIIKQIFQKLNQLNIICPPPYISVHEGYVDKRGVSTNQNLWTLRLNKQDSIIKLYEAISSYLKHLKRIHDLLEAYIAAKKNLAKVAYVEFLGYNQHE